MVIEQFAPFSRYSWSYQSTGKSTDTHFVFVRTNGGDTMSQMKKWKISPTKFLCMNDATSHNKVADNQKTFEALVKFLSELLPKKSSFEK